MKPILAMVRGLSAILLIVAVVINCANIAGRYLFSEPFASAEELMLFLLVAVVFFGNSVVAYEGRQIRMDVLLYMLPPGARYWFDLMADVTAIAVSITLIVVGWPAISMLIEFDQRSQAAEIPLIIPQACVPIGLGLTAIFLCIRIAGRIASHRSGSEAPQPESLH